MADVNCPMCSKANPADLDECQFCGARLTPLLASSPDDSGSIKAGEQPIKRDTAEFEKVKLPDQGPIHPGESPTKKDTAELEKALPTWLRSVRQDKDEVTGETPGEPPTDESPSAAPQAAPTFDSSGDLPGWLSGLKDPAAGEEDEVPDWLAGLRADEGEPASATGAAFATQEEDEAQPLDEGEKEWMTRLGRELRGAAPETPAESVPAAAPAEESPDWLQSLPSIPAETPQEEERPDWLAGLASVPAESAPAPGGEAQAAPAEDLPDWMSALKGDSAEVEPPAGEAPVPDWLAASGSGADAPAAAPVEDVPETPSAAPSFAEESPLAGEVPSGKPDWLAGFQADLSAAEEAEKRSDEFEVAPETPTGDQPGAASPLGSSALISDEHEGASAVSGEAAFSMESPDWLSTLKPEQKERRRGGIEQEGDRENLEAGELPSWVQAMRPVEAVVSEAQAASPDEEAATEESGPLAGLQGVLPVGPGLGHLRKPPRYSAKLRLSENQEKYADYLERLVMQEGQAKSRKTVDLASSRIWRWAIALLLVLAVSLPLLTGTQLAPMTTLLSSDKGAAAGLVDGLPANAPVLLVFDYDPALSGELEAAAAPVIDRLLSRRPRLGLVSTSPTGPALAERFLRQTPLVNVHNLRSGQQYVNLGYLAGGPAGVLFFAAEPTRAVQFNVDGQSVWETPPLLGIGKLSDFQAVFVLTDNADSGRDWIEQAGPYLGDTPMMMIISAQAEPMIRPYFDSGQLKGLVAGLLDAKIYEQNYGTLGLANRYWNSFSTGTLAAVMLIVGGALGSAAAGWQARRSRSGEEA